MSYIDDPAVSEVLINGPDQIYVERKGHLTRVPEKFENEDDLVAAAKNIAQFVGKRLTREAPMVDARLPDGSRVHLVSFGVSAVGTIIAIRKFPKDKLTVQKLIQVGAMTEEMLEFLRICVLTEKNMIVSGGTSSGKTSLLNALSALIPADERILVLEDSAELQLQQEHVVPFEVRHADRHGRGGVLIRDLFHSALRLRPDRVVIGEIRGGEAIDLIQAMTSGHTGSMSTLHANTPADSLNRLETMALMSNIEIPQKALRTQVAQAIDVIVQAARFRDGSRRVTHISESLPLGPEGN
jgi:pilus assembly protein CpaF